jgi:aminotransferase
VALKLERDNGLKFDPATEILATTGATFGIHAALTALLNEGDEVMMPDPVYDAYQSPIRLAGGRVKSVPAPIVDGRFALTEEALEAAWTPAVRVLILNTPWNPVGTVFTAEELAAIARFCERRNVTLLSDEIYEAITYGKPHVSPLAAAPSLRDRTVLVNSLSKTYAMTGWRVGYCAGAAALIQSMFMVLAQSSRGPATFIQDAAAAALAGPQDCVTEMRAEYTRRREQVLTSLDGIPGVKMLPPEGGFFAMVDVRGLNLPSNDIRRRLMNDHGVVVVHGSAYGAGGEGTLRVSFASGGDTLARGLARLREGLLACK